MDCPEYVSGDKAGFEHGLDGVALRCFEKAGEDEGDTVEGDAAAVGVDGSVVAADEAGTGNDATNVTAAPRPKWDALSLTMGLLEEVFERFPDPYVREMLWGGGGGGPLTTTTKHA